MRANLITGFFGTGLVGILAIWLAIEHEARLRLADEHRELESQLSRMVVLSSRNEEMSNLVVQAVPRPSLLENESRELLRLRGQVGVLRQQVKDLESVRRENRQVHAELENAGAARNAATADFWPRGSWGFSGYATPEAALQSSLWSSDNGDLKALLAVATGEMRKMIERDLGGKSEEEACIRAMDEVFNIKAVRVLNREVQADGAMVLTAAFEERNGTNVSKLLLEQIGGDWKLSGPAE
jgi:hypothetical protein